MGVDVYVRLLCCVVKSLGEYCESWLIVRMTAVFKRVEYCVVPSVGMYRKIFYFLLFFIAEVSFSFL